MLFPPSVISKQLRSLLMKVPNKHYICKKKKILTLTCFVSCQMIWVQCPQLGPPSLLGQLPELFSLIQDWIALVAQLSPEQLPYPHHKFSPLPESEWDVVHLFAWFWAKISKFLLYLIRLVVPPNCLAPLKKWKKQMKFANSFETLIMPS